MLCPSYYYLLETNVTLFRADILHQGFVVDRSAAFRLSLLANLLALIFFLLTVQLKRLFIRAGTLGIAYVRTSLEDIRNFAVFLLLL